MAKRNKNAYLAKKQLERANDDHLLKYITFCVTKQQTMDKVIIALGELGCDHDFMRRFKDKYEEVDAQYCEEVVSDANADADREYSRAKIDSVLKQYVPSDIFVPYDERYDFT